MGKESGLRGEINTQKKKNAMHETKRCGGCRREGIVGKKGRWVSFRGIGVGEKRRERRGKGERQRITT